MTSKPAQSKDFQETANGRNDHAAIPVAASLATSKQEQMEVALAMLGLATGHIKPRGTVS